MIVTFGAAVLIGYQLLWFASMFQFWNLFMSVTFGTAKLDI
jgi:hypothetical protein